MAGTAVQMPDLELIATPLTLWRRVASTVRVME
jgi:hypothetical protein